MLECYGELWRSARRYRDLCIINCNYQFVTPEDALENLTFSNQLCGLQLFKVEINLFSDSQLDIAIYNLS